MINKQIKFYIHSLKASRFLYLRLTDKQNEKMRSIIKNTPFERIFSFYGTIQANVYCFNCNTYCNGINEYHLSGFKKELLTFCSHERKKKFHRKRRIIISISINYNSLDDKIIKKSFKIVPILEARKLKSMCGNYIAKQIYNTEQYNNCESETKPLNKITLRKLKKYINRDVFLLLQKEIYKLKEYWLSFL